MIEIITHEDLSPEGLAAPLRKVAIAPSSITTLADWGSARAISWGNQHMSGQFYSPEPYDELYRRVNMALGLIKSDRKYDAGM